MTHDSVRQGSAQLISHILQTVSASLGAFIAISIWGLSGLFFHFSDSWQRVIATGTAIAAFLMILSVQRALAREANTVRRRLDELARALPASRRVPPPLPRVPVELDKGYGRSHGYAAGHSGPSGPGDAPVRVPPPPPPIRRQSAFGAIAQFRRDGRTS
jgi:hypothetical protein